MKRLLILALMLFIPLTSWAAISYVSESDGSNYSGSNFNSIATTALSTTTGNLIVVTVGYGTNAADVSSVTDTAGNTYTHGTSCANTSSGSAIGTDIWYVANATGNAANIVTAHFSTGLAYVGVTQLQYSGAAITQSVTCAVGNSSSSTTVTSGSFNPTLSGGVNVATGNGSGGATWTAGSSYTLRGSSNTTEDYANAPSGSQTASFTINTPLNMIISAANFQPTSGGGGSTTTTINNATVNNATIN